MRDHYLNYAELQSHEVEGRDYAITWRRADPRILIMAPHGGLIERHTSDIAAWIAGDGFSYYSFTGLKEQGTGALHITSHRFDEPQALAAVAEADYVLTVHGQVDLDEPFIVIGGLDMELRETIKNRLESAGFSFKQKQGLEGKSLQNICNRGRCQKGVQLELSYALRKALVTDHEMRKIFVASIQEVLAAEGRR